jgi:hypothetical protein
MNSLKTTANISEIGTADVSGKFKLLLRVEASGTQAEKVGVSAIIDLICQALLSHGFTWQFS